MPRHLGLRTAAKPDSQDVCFIHSESGRRTFLADRMALHPGVVVDSHGRQLGEVPAVELVTVGQRKGLGVGGVAARSYAVEVDVPRRRVVVGTAESLATDRVRDRRSPPGSPTPCRSAGERSCSRARTARVFEAEYTGDRLIRLTSRSVQSRSVRPSRLYDPDEPETVVGSALAARPVASGRKRCKLCRPTDAG